MYVNKPYTLKNKNVFYENVLDNTRELVTQLNDLERKKSPPVIAPKPGVRRDVNKKRDLYENTYIQEAINEPPESQTQKVQNSEKKIKKKGKKGTNAHASATSKNDNSVQLYENNNSMFDSDHVTQQPGPTMNSIDSNTIYDNHDIRNVSSNDRNSNHYEGLRWGTLRAGVKGFGSSFCSEKRIMFLVICFFVITLALGVAAISLAVVSLGKANEAFAKDTGNSTAFLELQNELAVLTQEMMMLSSNLSNCTETNKNLQRDIRKLNMSYTSIKSNITEIKTVLNSHTRNITHINSTVQENKEAIDDLKVKSQDHSDEITNIKLEFERQKVVFSAFLAPSENSSIAGNLQFNNIVVNVGDNVDEHLFVCPYTGYYFFTLSLNLYNLYGPSYGTVSTSLRSDMGGVNTDGEILILLNSSHDVSVNHTFYQQSSNSIIWHCETGHKVWLYYEASTPLIGGGSEDQSTFSGMFLYSSNP